MNKRVRFFMKKIYGFIMMLGIVLGCSRPVHASNVATAAAARAKLTLKAIQESGTSSSLSSYAPWLGVFGAGVILSNAFSDKVTAMKNKVAEDLKWVAKVAAGATVVAGSYIGMNGLFKGTDGVTQASNNLWSLAYAGATCLSPYKDRIAMASGIGYLVRLLAF
jgi:hypothetical protein